MQVKKEEVREKLLEAGFAIFSEEGFEKASLRKIVKAAGTTIGNFYNYFENKEALFSALVKDEYDKFMYILAHHEEEEQRQERPDELWDSSDVDMWNEVLTEFIAGLVPAFTPGFLLLADRSDGTSYSGFRDEVVRFFQNHYLEHVESYGREEDDGYSWILSEMFVDGLLAVIRRGMGSPDLSRMVVKHFMFFTIGTMGLIKNEERKSNDD